MQVFGPTVRFNVQVTSSRHSYEAFRENWLLCERLGYDVAYSVDHYVSGQPSHPIFEGPTVLSAMLAQKWKSGGGVADSGEAVRAGQIRSFKIVQIDAEKKRIDLELQP